MTARLFVISAPSGAGKTTLTERLLAGNRNLVRSISVTTRPMRTGEREGSDYFFVSQEEFLRRMEKGEFLEWARVFGYYYGTPRFFVERQSRRGRDVLACVDVQGARQIKRKCPGAVLVFIFPPSIKVLQTRLKKRRTESKNEIQTRLRKARWEMSQAKGYDYQVVNDRIEKAVGILKAIIHAEHARVKR